VPLALFWPRRGVKLVPEFEGITCPPHSTSAAPREATPHPPRLNPQGELPQRQRPLAAGRSVRSPQLRLLPVGRGPGGRRRRHIPPLHPLRGVGGQNLTVRAEGQAPDSVEPVRGCGSGRDTRGVAPSGIRPQAYLPSYPAGIISWLLKPTIGGCRCQTRSWSPVRWARARKNFHASLFPHLGS
jgi:hypothetical protein